MICCSLLCCLFIRWLCLAPYRWLGLLSNVIDTLLDIRGASLWTVSYSVRPLETVSRKERRRRIPVLEGAAQSEELSGLLLVAGSALQSEEGVMLDGTLPQMFTGLVRGQVEDERVQLDLPVGLEECRLFERQEK